MHGYQDETREYRESDWKLFRKRIIGWQENYMNKLNKEYTMILLQEKNPSENFWELEKRINRDKRKTGVMADMRRSKLIENILDLLHEGAIMLEDLDDFSDELKDTVQLYVQHYPEIRNIQNH